MRCKTEMRVEVSAADAQVVAYTMCHIEKAVDKLTSAINEEGDASQRLITTRSCGVVREGDRYPWDAQQPWRTENPPKDGTTIVAVGRILWSSEALTSADPFVAALVWKTGGSGYEGWYYASDELTVARTPGDEVVIDWWLPMPREEDLAGRDVHCPRQRGASEAREAQTAPNPAGDNLPA